ncbi:triacylglycerol lipase 2-like [Gastrolobium bilobum]|uniref:triacylglycerol lipase 2-like n=1 Tax=Gastrolobium bilobum TaxID=150636 RepID=UPI002AB0A2E7|nr:triacylglycerol lipase 2-like [Gastrolobium bilobum]
MASLGLMGLATLTLCLLVLATVPHQAHALSRGSFGTKNVAVEPSVDGLCASSVTIHGYKCQELEVTTKDGYILSLQRIPQGRAEVNGRVAKKEPVIIQHGVLVDGMTWFMNSPEQNLPLILADNGFDVWIANARGTRFSRRHTYLDPSNPAYWNWSWDEMVTYDMPAIFDYVSNQTGQKINYVGHSLGTLVALTSFSEGKLVNQLKSVALLSPIAYLSYMKTAIGVIAANSFVGETITLMGVAEFDPKGIPVMNFLKSVCANPGVDCKDLLTALTGYNCCLNKSSVSLLLKNEPQPTSTKTMVHLSQTVRSGVLAKFNYERPNYNIMHYGQLSPPVYNLSNIPHNLPLFISYGGQDALSDVIDVGNLLDILKFHDVDKLSVQYIKEYAHADFIMGVNAKDIVFNAVTAFFKRQFNT